MDFSEKYENELVQARYFVVEQQKKLDQAIGKLRDLELMQAPLDAAQMQDWIQHIETIAAAKAKAVESLRDIESEPARILCIACQDRIEAPNLAVAPCHHTYCKACVLKRVTISLASRTRFTAMCCSQAFDLANDINKNTLGDKLVHDYLARQAEREDIHPTYCAVPTCSAWIHPNTIHDNVGTCPQQQCLATTCSLCKTAAHAGSACPKDEAWELVLDLAAKEKWQQCPGCKMIVEWVSDCYTICKS